MKIIVDTHIFLWLMYDPNKIDKNHRNILEDMSSEVYLSSLSLAITHNYKVISVDSKFKKYDCKFL